MIEDKKPAGFDERIMVTTDWWELAKEHKGTTLISFLHAATSETLDPPTSCLDDATSLEEAAQMLEAYAAHVRGLSKDGWYADDASNPGEDWYELSRDLK